MKHIRFAFLCLGGLAMTVLGGWSLGCLADFSFAQDMDTARQDVVGTEAGEDSEDPTWDSNTGTADASSESEDTLPSTETSVSSSDTNTDSGTGAISCNGIVCDAPPASECIDADHMRSYAAQGTCTAGECVYPSESVECPFGCEANTCREHECDDGPCCAQGEFLGPEVQCDAAPVSQEYGCASKQCGSDALQRSVFRHCTGLSAECGLENLLPGPWTVVEACDANSLCRWDMSGAWCENCSFGCSESACQDDPCKNVTCAGPDEDYCLGANQLRDFRSFGVCSGGDCLYEFRDVYCSTGCETLAGDDRCAGNPCQGVSCDQIPQDICLDDEHARTYGGVGFCSNGECEYPYTEEYCPFGCDGLTGRCADPQCTEGPCCESGHFRSSATVCETKIEYRCGGDVCGADPESRTVERRCSGLSAACDGASTPGPWTVVGSCSASQVCGTDGLGAWCTDCAFGCGNLGCYPQCAPADPCCDASGHLRSSSFVCGTRTEYRCDSGSCGAVAQSREVVRSCNGLSARCEGTETIGSWTTVTNCSASQVCSANSGGATCVSCSYGCENGACKSTQCSSGPCCEAGFYKTAGTLCDTRVEYSCESTSCGADGVERTVTRACTGTSATCDGAPVYSAPTTIAACDGSSLCSLTGSGATCNTCPLGCASGACDTVCTKGVNVAPGATSSASAGGTGSWGPQNLNDGRKNTDSCYFSWVTAQNATSDAWFRLVWSTPQTLWGIWVDINKLDDKTCWDGSTLSGATIQWWNGSDWVTDGTVSGKTDDFSYQFTSPVTTTQVRLFRVYASVASSGQKNNPLVFEMEAYKCD